MTSIRDMKKALFGDHVASGSKKDTDPYDALDGSGWELVPITDDHVRKMSPNIQEMIMMLKSGIEDGAIPFFTRRLEHFRVKTRDGVLDSSCLDIAMAYQWLDEILYYHLHKAQWPEYKAIYDIGVELVDHLEYLSSKDPGLPIIGTLNGLKHTISEYKDIQETEDNLL